MLAGVALGIAAGTKWYGVSSVAVVVAIWIGARIVTRARAGADRDGAAATRDVLIVGGLALAGVLPWLARNLALSDNPVFPLKVAPLGMTIFDAPPDVIRDQAGFTIADYVGDAGVLWQLAGEMIEGLGLAPIVCGLAIALAVLLARRRGARAGRTRPRCSPPAPSCWALLYTVTPATALGLRGDPSLAHANTRYAVPALVLAMPIVAWVGGRLPRRRRSCSALRSPSRRCSAPTAATRCTGSATSSSPPSGSPRSRAASWLLWRLRARRIVLVAAALAAALVGVAAAYRVEDRINDGRYRNIDPAVDALLDAAPGGRRIGLASDWSVGGLSPVWPAFGTRIDNEVEYVGHFVRGFMTPYRDAASFQAALRRGRFDLLVVGRGFYPPEATPEQRWAIDAGWRTIALSTRLRVLARRASPRG